MERPTCSTCVFFEPARGLCRRNPPTIFGEVSNTRDRSYQEKVIYTLASSQFPQVDESDWCGEHPDFPAFVASRPAG